MNVSSPLAVITSYSVSRRTICKIVSPMEYTSLFSRLCYTLVFEFRYASHKIGDKYERVPTIELERAVVYMVSIMRILLTPKSAILISFSLLMRIFSGFMSR